MDEAIIKLLLKGFTEAYIRAVGDGKLPIDGFADVSYRIFNSRKAGMIFLYFCIEKEATAGTLIERFMMPKSSVYRVLKTLSNMGVIKVGRILSKPPKTGGTRERLWKLVR